MIPPSKRLWRLSTFLKYIKTIVTVNPEILYWGMYPQAETKISHP